MEGIRFLYFFPIFSISQNVVLDRAVLHGGGSVCSKLNAADSCEKMWQSVMMGDRWFRNGT